MITILLATYNGEHYLAEQIESILTQTERDWRLVIQDDCSTDKTAAVAQQYADAHPDRIKFIRRHTPSGSAKNNFFSMLSYIDSDYWMACDQDDVWLPEKLQWSMCVMREMEQKAPNIPLLVHTDLTVVDQDQKVIAESLFAYQKLDGKRDSFANLLSQNIVTGCTTLMNRALLDRIQSVPAEAMMHDWWFALVAAAFGRIAFIEQPTVLYRQHGENSVGAKNARSFLYLVQKATKGNEIKNMLKNTFLQAERFLNDYEKDLSDSLREICLQFIALPQMSKIQKIRCLREFNFWKSGITRKIGQIVFI